MDEVESLREEEGGVEDEFVSNELVDQLGKLLLAPATICDNKQIVTTKKFIKDVGMWKETERFRRVIYSFVRCRYIR